MARREDRYYTAEEYLAFEGAAEGKHEYFDGRIYAMSGATLSHNRIVINLIRDLGTQLRGRRCEAFGSDLKARVPETGLYTYPDVSALCGEPRFDRHEQGILLNPSVIIEVLSPSTEAYDRGEKFAHYRRVPSLREYVLISQDRVCVERFARADDAGAEWTLTTADAIDGAMELPSIGCALRLRDVYERVDFPPEPPLRAVYEQMAGYQVA